MMKIYTLMDEKEYKEEVGSIEKKKILDRSIFLMSNSLPDSNYIRIKVKFRVTGNDSHIFTQCCRDNVSIKWIFVFFMNVKRLIIEDMRVANRNCFDSCLLCMDYDILKAYWNFQLANINFYCHLPEGDLADKNL